MPGARAISSGKGHRLASMAPRTPRLRAALWLSGLALLLGSPGQAAAASLTLPFAVELGGSATGSLGTLQIDELAGGDLALTIALGADLGPSADLQDFSFNLPAAFQAGLAVSGSLCDGGSCATPFALESGAPTRGGAGAEFDFRVGFGDGSGANGNGTLALASFVLGSDVALSIADLFAEESATSDGLALHFAAHAQATGAGADSAAIGVAAPEPDAALLLLFGLGLTGLARRIGGPRRRAATASVSPTGNPSHPRRFNER